LAAAGCKAFPVNTWRFGGTVIILSSNALLLLGLILLG